MMDGLEQPSLKKRKSSRRTREVVPFRPGFLRKIRVWNFTTYSYTEFVLSPTLNMIIGPNGSGKSTLVAAICIGLAGKIDLIKRKNLKSMIKTGHERAAIEITIENEIGEEPIVVERDFSAKESIWSINRKKSTESAVKELRSKFNIQLDNLCHFLPQERVAEFAGLSSEKLLMETERTLKDGHLLAMHEDLIQKDTKSQEFQLKIEQLKNRLEQLHLERSKLEEEARKLQDYENKSKELENHRLLIPYARWQDMKEKQSHLKHKKNQAKKRLSLFDQNFAPLREDLGKLKLEIETQNTKVQKSEKEGNFIKSNIERHKDKLRNTQDEISALVQNLESYKTRTEQKKQELEQVRSEIQNLIEQRRIIGNIDKTEIEELSASYSESKSILRDLQNKLDDQSHQINDLSSDIKDLTMKMRREENRLQGNDKLDLLMAEASRERKPFRLRDDSFKMHCTLRELDEFRGNYFEAPVISCNVKERHFAAAVEKVVDKNTLFAFTVSSQLGYELMNEYSQRTKTNTPLRKLAEVRIPKPEFPAEKLASLGFEGYLLDYVTGPTEVLSMLCNSSKLHAIPISRHKLTEAQIKRLTDSSSGSFPFRKFISGDTLFNVMKSKYGSKQVYYSTEKISRSNFFETLGLSESEKKTIKSTVENYKAEIREKKEIYAEYKTRVEGIESKIRSVKNQLSQIKGRQQKLKEVISNATKIEGRITIKGEKAQKLERDANKDYTHKIRSYEQRITDKYAEFSAESAEMSELFCKYSNQQIESKLCDFEMLELKNRQKTAESLVEELRQLEKKLQQDYIKYKNEYEKIKESPEYEEMKKTNARYTEEERILIAGVAQVYIESNTFTESTIRKKMEHFEDELSVMSTADRGSVNLLRIKLQEIERAETDLPKFEADKFKLDEKIRSISTVWKAELSKFIHQISLAFSKRFGKVGSEGRVELVEGERFKDWKLQIMVKFRQESELKVLDHQSQSGGERAVSTIFFIMSLQGLSDAPFRIVDEINQGMDPKNEQMAHRYLVHTACTNHKSQYFLVTPKLLTGLYYHPDMMIHCIFTGPLLEENNDRKEGGFLDFANRFIAA